MKKRTLSEMRECIDILLRVMDDIPWNYADLVLAELARKGLTRTRRQIYRAKSLETFDLEVMKIIEKVSKPAVQKKVKSVRDYSDYLRRTGL